MDMYTNLAVQLILCIILFTFVYMLAYANSKTHSKFDKKND